MNDANDQLGGSYSLREFLSCAFKDKKWLAAAFFVPLGLATVAAIVLPPSYMAKSSLMARLGRESIYQPEIGEANTPPISANRDEMLKSELNILASRDLEEAVLKEIGVARFAPALAEAAAKTGRRWEDLALLGIEDNLDAQLVKDTSVIEVTFSHKDPVVAAEFINRLVAEYIKKRLDLLSEHRTPFMEGEVSAYRDRLNEVESQIKNFKRDKKIISFDRQRELLLTELNGIDVRLEEVNAKLAEVKGRLEVMGPRAAGAAAGGPSAQDREGYRLSSVRDLVATEEIRLRAEERSAEATRNTLMQQRTSVSKSLDDFSAQESTLEQMLREKTIVEARYQSNSKRLEDARIMEDLDKRAKTSVSVIQAAVPPVKRKNTHLIILALGVVVSFISMVVVAFVCDLFRIGFLIPDQLQRSLGLPVLASFARLPPRANPRDTVTSGTIHVPKGLSSPGGIDLPSG